MPTVFCVGRNYAEHAVEMGVHPRTAGDPVVFLKPWHALVQQPAQLTWPAAAGRVHHEVELVLRMGPARRPQAIAVGLDLTDRDRQARAKAEGLPWAAAKGFLGSAPVGPFVLVNAAPPLERLRFTLKVNGELRQRGETGRMLYPIPTLLERIDRWFGLRAGDVVFTGTPAGVAELHPGDGLLLEIEEVPAALVRMHVTGPTDGTGPGGGGQVRPQSPASPS